MQRVFASPWTPEEYQATQAHRQIVPEPECANCRRAVSLRRHGWYARWVVCVLGQVWRLCIARFLCPLCRRTMSYLPDFALSYRLLGPATFQAFLDGNHDRPDVRSFHSLLHGYRRALLAFGGELVRTVGAGLGRPPPRHACGLWSWLKKAGEGLAPITRHLVTTFRIGLFRRYQCHQPAGP